MSRQDENKTDAMRYFWVLFLAGLALTDCSELQPNAGAKGEVLEFKNQENHAVPMTWQERYATFVPNQEKRDASLAAAQATREKVAALQAKGTAERAALAAEYEKKAKAETKKPFHAEDIPLAVRLSSKKLGFEVSPEQVANYQNSYYSAGPTWMVVLANGDVLQFSYFPDSGLIYYHKREDQ